MQKLLLLCICFFSLFSFSQIDSTIIDEEIILETTNGKIVGSLLSPKINGKIPIAIIIAGSGPTDQDGNSMMMKTNAYKMLAHQLYKNGIATLRYDKRAIGKSASSNTIPLQNLTIDDYANDVKLWAEKLLKDKRFSKIILIGHSEGSLLGILASENNKSISKFVSISGAGQSIDVILKQQIKKQSIPVYEMSIPIIDSLKSGNRVNNVPNMLQSVFNKNVQNFMISWMKYEPKIELSKLKIPILILQGNKDIQVNAEESDFLQQGNPSSKKVIIANMNHVLKVVESDNPNDNVKTYYDINLPLAKDLVTEIIQFINLK